jgi:hypothetical protein
MSIKKENEKEFFENVVFIGLAAWVTFIGLIAAFKFTVDFLSKL